MPWSIRLPVLGATIPSSRAQLQLKRLAGIAMEARPLVINEIDVPPGRKEYNPICLLCMICVSIATKRSKNTTLM
jgi:hypothetical protein